MIKRNDVMLTALMAAYAGPITKCRPGRARAPEPKKKRDRAGKWLSRHLSDKPVTDPREKRRRLRMARAERDRIAKYNAAVGHSRERTQNQSQQANQKGKPHETEINPRGVAKKFAVSPALLDLPR
jgi:hypothetical protein